MRCPNLRSPKAIVKVLVRLSLTMVLRLTPSGGSKPTSARVFSERGIIRAAIKPSTAAKDIQSPGMARFPVI